jgi:phosphoribosylformimino-5-aminoimidazole carboxamide ribotide isomerase
MQLIPAIDLLDGECVRLHRGNFAECKVYDVDTLSLARDYADAGADWLHVVDLAASRDGEDADNGPLFRLLGGVKQNVQTGGGVRKRDDISARLDHGADRVVVGSISVTQPARFGRWLRHFGSDALVAALDVRLDDDGLPWPRIYGWTEGSEHNLWDLLEMLAGEGLKHVLCTDISRDGAMYGPNLDLYVELTQRYPGLQIQASGGVSGLRDLERLTLTGAAAAITGKALLEQCFTVREALEAIAGENTA